ncbi:MAG: hypothetical protein JW904_06265 [Spirochaetales bacterium]|nr:hypothetical protein [Spirochaetales bacterium]
MIEVFKIPLHDAFRYSIFDDAMPHPDTLDREGDLVFALSLTADGKIGRIESFQNGECHSVKEYFYREEKISVEKESFPETGGVNEIIYTYHDSGYKKEFLNCGELDYSEHYTQNAGGIITAFCKLDAEGRVVAEFQANDKGDIVYFRDEAGENSYSISYNQRNQLQEISFTEDGVKVLEKYFYSGDLLAKKEIWYDEYLSELHEYTTEDDGKRVVEKVSVGGELAYEVFREDDKFHGHFVQISKVHNNRLRGFRGHAYHGSDSGKCEIKYGRDGRIEELLSSNEKYMDPLLGIQFEPNAYYFLEEE